MPRPAAGSDRWNAPLPAVSSMTMAMLAGSSVTVWPFVVALTPTLIWTGDQVAFVDWTTSSYGSLEAPPLQPARAMPVEATTETTMPSADRQRSVGRRTMIPPHG